MSSSSSLQPSKASRGISPFAPFQTFWLHRKLIFRLAGRELEARYRGSMLGAFWMVATPLLMLTVYTFVFTTIFQSRWGKAGGGSMEFASLLFSGLILFGVFSECVTRAPGVVLENVSYIKKVVFPLEILPLVGVVVSLVNAVLSFFILLMFYFPLFGIPPLTSFLLPFVLLPLILMTLGVSWFLASAGVYLRDLRQIVGLLVTLLMFLTPIFYPLEAVPKTVEAYIHFNPLTLIMEQSKDLLFWARLPDITDWALSVIMSWGCAWLGYVWFMKTRKGFADVV